MKRKIAVNLSREKELEYMELAIRRMKESRTEWIREDNKVSPSVGAVIVMPDGNVDSACRGELREGDHAEYTLLERKHRSDNLEGSILFATLEPCAPGARKSPKMSCSERICNARIAKVYIGIQDPDPTVAGAGFRYLESMGIETAMFPRHLQEEIEEYNKEFLRGAKLRAQKANNVIPDFNDYWSSIVPNCRFNSLSPRLLKAFLQSEGKNTNLQSSEALDCLLRLGLIAKQDDEFLPTMCGYLLFGTEQHTINNQAVIKASYLPTDGKEDIITIDGPLLEQPQKIYDWYKSKIDKYIDRSQPKRRDVYEYPLEVITEVIKNALLHRDYSIQGAPVYFSITNEVITVKSPGSPVKPITIEQINGFNAPSLARNPKLMYVFNKMGLAEQTGLGFKTIRELPDKSNIPLPDVTYQAPYLVLELVRSMNLKATGKMSNCTIDEIKKLEFIRMEGKVSRKVFQEHFGLAPKAAERILKRFADLDLIQKIGGGRGTYYIIKEK